MPAQLQGCHAYLRAVPRQQLNEIVCGKKNRGGVFAGVHGYASGIDDFLVDNDSYAVFDIVERAERRDRSGDEAEHRGQVSVARKREAPCTQALLDFAEGNAF